jgi:hypothetical protein
MVQTGTLSLVYSLIAGFLKYFFWRLMLDHIGLIWVWFLCVINMVIDLCNMLELLFAFSHRNIEGDIMYLSKTSFFEACAILVFHLSCVWDFHWRRMYNVYMTLACHLLGQGGSCTAPAKGYRLMVECLRRCRMCSVVVWGQHLPGRLMWDLWNLFRHESVTQRLGRGNKNRGRQSESESVHNVIQMVH